MSERRWRTVAMVVLTIAVAYFFLRGPFWPTRKRLWDYAVFASAAELWVRGQDPYDDALVEHNWSASPPGWGVERDVRWVRSNAPPTTLAMMAPFGLFGHTGGAIVYLVSTSALMAYAAWRVGRWAGVGEGTPTWLYAAGLLVSTPLIMGTGSGNPVMLAAPLSLLAFERGRRGGAGLPGVMLGVAAAAKVQLGLPLIAVAVLWRPFRRLGMVAAVILAAIALVGGLRLTLAGVDWPKGLLANVAETNGPGGMNDYASFAAALDDHLELQAPLWRLVQSRPFANGGAWVLTGAAGIALVLVGWRRRDDPAAIPILLGTAAALSLLPVYHRTYDALILLPLIAAAVAGVRSSETGVRRASIGILILATAFWVPIGVDRLLERAGRFEEIRANSFYRAFLVTPRPWATLGILCLALRVLKHRFPASELVARPEKSLAQTQET